MKTKLFLTLSLLLIFQVYSIAQSVTIEFDNATSIMSKTQAAFEALEENDIDKVLSYYAEDAVIYGITSGTSQMTKSEYKAHMTFMKDSYTNPTFSNLAFLPVKSDSGFTKGEWIAVWCIVNQSDKKTGAKLEYPFHFIASWEEGKIKLMQAYVDALNIRQALGYTIVAPSASN